MSVAVTKLKLCWKTFYMLISVGSVTSDSVGVNGRSSQFCSKSSFILYCGIGKSNNKNHATTTPL
jgi:hypothetical protein